jgi:DNA-binding XRE family transcriptional regulator
VTVNWAEERIKRGLSQTGMAKAIKVSRGTLARAEEGKSVHPANALKIANFLEREVTEIWPIDTAAATT